MVSELDAAIMPLKDVPLLDKLGSPSLIPFRAEGAERRRWGIGHASIVLPAVEQAFIPSPHCVQCLLLGSRLEHVHNLFDVRRNQPLVWGLWKRSKRTRGDRHHMRGKGNLS